MNRRERDTRRLKEVAILLLVLLEQPVSDDDAIASIEEWETQPYLELVKSLNYALKRYKHAHTGLLWYLNLCTRMIEQAKDTRRETVNA